MTDFTNESNHGYETTARSEQSTFYLKEHPEFVKGLSKEELSRIVESLIGSIKEDTENLSIISEELAKRI